MSVQAEKTDARVFRFDQSGALLRKPEDEQGFAEDLLRLTNAEEYARWSAAALENAKRFTTAQMIANYCELYRSLAPV